MYGLRYHHVSAARLHSGVCYIYTIGEGRRNERRVNRSQASLECPREASTPLNYMHLLGGIRGISLGLLSPRLLSHLGHHGGIVKHKTAPAIAIVVAGVRRR